MVTAVCQVIRSVCAKIVIKSAGGATRATILSLSPIRRRRRRQKPLCSMAFRCPTHTPFNLQRCRCSDEATWARVTGGRARGVQSRPWRRRSSPPTPSPGAVAVIDGTGASTVGRSRAAGRRYSATSEVLAVKT